MHVTACLAGQKVYVEVEEDCRTLQALKDAIIEALPHLCVEEFDVSVGGRALDDENIVSLEESVCLDVVPNTRVLSVLALREAGREVSEAGLLDAAAHGDTSLCTLYLDAEVPVDCVDDEGDTPLHLACAAAQLELVTLLLDRGSTAIGKQNCDGESPLHLASLWDWELSLVALLLDRGCSVAVDKCKKATP